MKCSRLSCLVDLIQCGDELLSFRLSKLFCLSIHHQVKGLMMYEGKYSSPFKNTLAAAASSGDKDTWEVILAELQRREVEVTPHRMRNTGGPPEKGITYHRLAAEIPRNWYHSCTRCLSSARSFQRASAFLGTNKPYCRTDVERVSDFSTLSSVQIALCGILPTHTVCLDMYSPEMPR